MKIEVIVKNIFLLMLLYSCTSVNNNNPPLETVSYVNINRYLGKWYEIARFDQRFQRGCTATTADYSLRPDGDIKVVNSCRLGSPDGKLKTAVGRAWVKDKKTNAKLKVQFFLTGIRLGIFSGNYWIIALGKDYEYAMVGDSSRKYLWILSRKPNMDAKTYKGLVSKAADLKFDTSKLLKTQHVEK